MKVVLITGASTGIGKEFAYKYASKGYNLLLIARSEDKLKNIKISLEKEYKINVNILVKDLTKNNAAKEIYEYTKEKNLIIDILINNAGFGDFGYFSQCDIKKQSQMVQLNIITLTELTHYYLKDMIAINYGKILNVASIASFMPGPKMSVYYATKAFVLSFTEAIAEEIKNYNIKISALCPGPTATNFEKNAKVNFSSLKMQSTKEVVNYAFNKFMKTKTVIILPNINNKLLAVMSKIAPRFIVRKAVYTIQKNFRQK